MERVEGKHEITLKNDQELERVWNSNQQIYFVSIALQHEWSNLLLIKVILEVVIMKIFALIIQQSTHLNHFNF